MMENKIKWFFGIFGVTLIGMFIYSGRLVEKVEANENDIDKKLNNEIFYQYLKMHKEQTEIERVNSKIIINKLIEILEKQDEKLNEMHSTQKEFKVLINNLEKTCSDDYRILER